MPLLSRNFALGLTIALAIGAYPLLASSLSYIGAGDSRLPSILLRLMVAGFALYTTWLNRQSLRMYSPLFVTCFLLFWGLYIFRVVDNAYMSQVELGVDPQDVLAMIAFFVLLPSLPMFAGLNPWSSRWAFNLLVAISLLTALTVAPQFENIATDLQYEGNIRFSLERLNPISVGYVGATLLVLGVVGTFQTALPRSLFMRGVMAAAAIAGLFTIIIAASRGPVVAAALALLAYGLIPLRPARLGVAAAIGAGIVVVTSSVRTFVLQRYEFDIYSRFIDAAEGYSGSVTAREESFAGAWQQYLDSPVLGDAIIERSTGGYPHNLILESLMATGTIGGLAFIIIMALMAMACLRLLAREGGYEWLGAIGIVFAMSGMFSGAHYTSDLQWLTIVLVIITEVKLRTMEAGRFNRRT